MAFEVCNLIAGYLEYKSNTTKKKEALALQDLGERLVTLSKERLKDLDLPEEIFSAVTFAKTIRSHGARRRQMQYIGTLMRSIDAEPVRQALDHFEKGNYRKAMAFKETEKWRDELARGNRMLMEEILIKCPDADRQKLTQLARQAGKERENERPPRASRTLFRYLIEIRETCS